MTADPGTMPFGKTTYFSAKLLGWSRKLLPSLRQNKYLPTDFGQNIEPFSIGNPTFAVDIYARKFQIAGQIISSTPHEVFTLRLGQADQYSALFGLDWLRHFNAAKRSLHDQHAMRLLHYWSKSGNPKRSITQQLEILSALATHGQQIAKRCELLLQKDFLRIVSIELKILTSLKPHNAEDSVKKALAQFYCFTAFQNPGHLQAAAQELFDQNIDKIIMPDGGHVSGHVQKLIRFLEFAIPLHRLQSSASVRCLTSAVTRGIAHIRLLQGQDGKFSRVLGQDRQSFDPRLLFEFYGTEICRPELASNSGFARLDQGDSTIIAATNTALAIEFFDGTENLFHTKPQVGNQNHPAQLLSAPQGKALLMSSSSMKRTCFLSADGNDLRVEDEISGTAQIQTVIQISPTIKLSTLMEGQIIILVSQNKSVWHLRQRGGNIRIHQTSTHNEIVISHVGSRTNWSLKKQSSLVKPSRKKQVTSTELLI